MNPLSPFTYHVRHKRRALLLMALICLATLGVAVMVRSLGFLFEQTESSMRYLARFSVVRSLRASLDPGVVAQIRAHPGVARAIPLQELWVGVPLNTSGGYPLLGVSESDVQVLMDACDLHLREGRLLRARANEIMLSEEIASALGLQVGDRVGRSVDESYYAAIPTSLELVGILEHDPLARVGPSIRLGFVSREYLESHQAYTPGPPQLIVVAQDGEKETVDRFLEAEIGSALTLVRTQRFLAEDMAQGMLYFHLIFGVVDVLVAVVIALVVAAINRIALTQRLVEFGLLHALGHSRNRLARRLTLETSAVTMGGWIAGLLLAWLLFAWLKASLLEPGLDLDLGNLAPIWFAVPIPAAVIVFAGWSLRRMSIRLDAVAIIDRGELGLLSAGRWRAGKRSRRRRSTISPLSSRTFYRRHSRRGLALAGTMALMLVGVVMPAFLFAPLIDANKVLFEHLSYVSVVSPRIGPSLDPGVMAQIRTHPAVAAVVPATPLSLMVVMPPLSQNPVTLYGVSQDDLPALLDQFGLRLAAGRMPDARANEIVLSQALAMNRDLQVGDRAGRPVYEYDYGLPTEMRVSGILSQSDRLSRRGDAWVGFASQEYLNSHEAYASRPVSLLLIPAAGLKSELDAWLEEHVDSEQTAVGTYDERLRDHQRLTRMTLLLFVAIEGVVALVAAVALAVLSYVFFSQRREEFGTLHAIGHSRRWLVGRTVGETVAVVVVAWLIGAAVCLAGLVYMQMWVYAPKGLSLDLLSPAPWLFTLPMPLAVVAVSAGLVVWMLSHLDPVAIIERRS